MRRALVVVLLVFGFTTAAAAQGLPPRPATYPAGSIGSASRSHLLTLAEMRGFFALVKELMSGKDSAQLMVERPIFSDDSALTTELARLERMPVMRRLIARTGLTPREYLVAQSAAGELIETLVMQRVLDPSLVPVRVRWENVALYRANAAEFDPQLEAMGLPPDPAARAKSKPAAEPRPATLAAAARAHVLTLDEVRRLYALTRDRAALERATPSAFKELAAAREDEPLDSLAAQLSRVSAMRTVLTRHGFTPREYLVAEAALGATVRVIKFPELREAAEANGMAEPHPKNLAFYRAHAPELDSLLNALMKSSASDDPTPVGGDTAARRLRLLDSLSRMVRTDSLVRLHIVAIDAPAAAIPALAQEIGCEVARLNWRHGTGPALTAMRRMRDSLWAGRPEIYKRTNERLMPYGMAAPLTDEVCGWTRWPRAAASLMKAP